MQLNHHGFACSTLAGFTLAFAHWNPGDNTTFKTVNRKQMVVLLLLARRGTSVFVRSLERMMEAESPNKFGDLDAEENTILELHPSHGLIKPSTFAEVEGVK
jgi:hypothetical protein